MSALETVLYASAVNLLLVRIKRLVLTVKCCFHCLTARGGAGANGQEQHSAEAHCL